MRTEGRVLARYYETRMKATFTTPFQVAYSTGPGRQQRGSSGLASGTPAPIVVESAPAPARSPIHSRNAWIDREGTVVFVRPIE